MKAGTAKRSAGSVDVIVIGAGHSGLAISHYLTERSIDHVILERGEIANSWRHERWDSLKLLTPNWLSRLPGYQYAGNDRDSFMSMPEIIDFIDGYAEFSAAPVRTGTEVTSLRAMESGYHVVSNQGEWFTKAVVIASGSFNLPVVPKISAGVPENIHQITMRDYRNPNSVKEGGVLVVGASATGLQVADEIQDSGRPVTLAVGEHVRMPRSYRGYDIQYWMNRVGLLDEDYKSVDNIRRARRVPSPQLVGSEERLTLDLNSLVDKGVRLTGRLAGMRDGKALFSGSLRNVCALADLKMGRMLDAIDSWVDSQGLARELEPARRYAPTAVTGSSSLSLDLANGEISNIVWATGFRPDYSWLDVPVLDRKGQIRHDGGVADAPGLYVMGLPFLRRRKSSFIHGAEDDAHDLSTHLAAHLDDVSSSSLFRVAV